MQWNRASMTMAIPENGFFTYKEPCSLSIIFTNRNTPVIRTAIPGASVLSRQFDYDYCDSYLTTFKDARDLVQPEDFACAFCDTIPGYAKALLSGNTLRNFLNGFVVATGWFKRNKRQSPVSKTGAKAGELFTITTQTDNEVVLTLSRKHFNWNISLLLNKPRKDAMQKNAVLSTTVTFHTASGSFYFSLLKPLFENLMPVLLKRTIQKVEA